MHEIEQQLKRCNQLIAETDAAYHEAALKLGLTDSAMILLITLCERDEACLLGEAIRATGLRKQTVNSTIRKLEREGIIALEPVDGRQKRILLTPQGSAFAKRTVRRLMRVENEIFGAWEPEARECHLALMQRYLDDFKQKTEDL